MYRFTGGVGVGGGRHCTISCELYVTLFNYLVLYGFVIGLFICSNLIQLIFLTSLLINIPIPYNYTINYNSLSVGVHFYPFYYNNKHCECAVFKHEYPR